MTNGYPPCDAEFHIGQLRREGELLAAAAARAGLAASVPGCPGWQVRDLLRHIGYVHRWAAGFVRDQQPRPVSRLSEEEILHSGPADGSLPGWFADGHAALVETLSAADPGMSCWAFLEAPSPLAFWARRQAHETAIHRADAQQAAAAAEQLAGTAEQEAGTAEQEAHTAEQEAGSACGRWQVQPPFEPRFAADGIDELVMGFAGRSIRRGRWHGPAATLAIHADDGPAGHAGWLLAGGPDGARVARGAGPADCDVTGPAAGLYLLLWNRRQAGGVTVTGDPAVLAGVCGESRVTWG